MLLGVEIVGENLLEARAGQAIAMPRADFAEVQALTCGSGGPSRRCKRRRKSWRADEQRLGSFISQFDQANGGSRRERGEEVVGAGEIEGRPQFSSSTVSGYYAAQDFRTQEEITRRWISLVPS